MLAVSKALIASPTVNENMCPPQAPLESSVVYIRLMNVCLVWLLTASGHAWAQDSGQTARSLQSGGPGARRPGGGSANVVLEKHSAGSANQWSCVQIIDGSPNVFIGGTWRSRMASPEAPIMLPTFHPNALDRVDIRTFADWWNTFNVLNRSQNGIMSDILIIVFRPHHRTV